MTRPACLVALALAAALPRAQAEEPTFEALGQAPIAGGDPVRARERALDDAFRQALEQAAATLLPPAEMAARAAQLKLTIYPKARGFMVSYRVLEEGEREGLFQVRISAQVAVAALARELRSGQPAAEAKPAARRLWVCLAERTGAGAWAPSVLTAQLGHDLAARQLDVVVADGCAPSGDGAGLDDAQVAAGARGRNAQGAVAGLITVEPQGTVRGTRLALAHARASLALVQADARPVAREEAEGDAWGATEGEAAAAAARRALDGAVRALGDRMSRAWQGGAGASGGVVLHLGGLERWGDYQALLRALAAIPGVGSVTPLRFHDADVDLSLRTAVGASAIAAALGRAEGEEEGSRFVAQPLGELELTVRIQPAAPAPLGTPAPPPG